MKYLQYQNDELFFGVENKNYKLSRLVKDYDFPSYVYDLDIISDRAKRFKQALPGFKHYYAIKANFNPKVLSALKKVGYCIDAVSAGEIKRSLECGFAPSNIIFSGVGKSVAEISYANEQSIYQINAESISELKRIAEISSSLNKTTSVALRLNPDISIDTHPFIVTGLADNKFGIDIKDLDQALNIISSNKSLELVGFTMHLGSQMHDLNGLELGLLKLKEIFNKTKKTFKTLKRFNIGGGLGIFYQDESSTRDHELLEQYAALINQVTSGMDADFQAEPGRFIVARSAGLLCQVQYIKKTPSKNFVITDAGMNMFMRPVLYSAEHRILPLRYRGDDCWKVDVVGPICESSDFFAKDRSMPKLEEGDFLWIADTGAYGAAMASQYNLQPKVKEIFL